MDNIAKLIEELRDKAECLTEEKNRDITEYLNDIYAADFSDDRDFSDFSHFYDEDEDGYLDPMDLSMDEDDIISFLKWSYRLSLASHTENLADALEKTEDGEEEAAREEMISAAEGMKSFKYRLTEIIEIAENMIKEADSLIKIAEEYAGEDE